MKIHREIEFFRWLSSRISGAIVEMYGNHMRQFGRIKNL